MAETEKKVLAEANAQLKKERFEFILSLNGNIVCQRYFRIFGFKESSLFSTELVNTIKNIANIINNDLEAKTQVYLEMTAPQVFEDEEEMYGWLEKHGSELKTPTSIVLRQSEVNYLWNGEKVKTYQKPFNKHDYIGNTDDVPTYFTFTLYDNGKDLEKHKEVISYSWDANVYPKFVRFNIDLSNSKNPFKDELSKVVYAPFEAALIDAMNVGHRDLVPQIVHEFYDSCTGERDSNGNFTTTVDCGRKTYSLNVRKKNFQYEDSYRSYFQKKTDAYFSNGKR